MGLKVAVIGGGSTYTPELVSGIAARAADLPVDELFLHDPDAARLAIVGGLAGRMLRRAEWTGRLTCTTDRPAALDGAAFVLIQLRVGGQAARLSDETLPLRFGAIGQETTGAGGFAKAWRTVPVVLEIATEAAGRAPGAWLLDFTNPVGIVTQALLDAGHRAIGLCNVAIGVQRRIAAHYGVPPGEVAIEHVGLNHLSWVRRVTVGGIERTAELLADPAPIIDPTVLPAAYVRAAGALPSYYLRYYAFTDAVLASQRAGHARAAEVAQLERDLLAAYADPTLDHVPDLLSRRGGAFYSDAAVDLMASLYAGRGDIQVVDVRNDGALPDLAADDVVEVPARMDRDGAHPVPLDPLGPSQLELVRRVKTYERLAAMAATTGDRTVAIAALRANPLVPGAVAESLLDALLAAETGRRHA